MYLISDISGAIRLQSMMSKGGYNINICNIHSMKLGIVACDILKHEIESLVSDDPDFVRKEYLEFISLLKLYVNSQLPVTPIIHLVSLNLGILLLDENLNILELDKSNLNTKYLSDISFSDNDYVLNTLLNLLPRKLYLHLANNSPENFEFINTIKLVFENRIEICTDCDICNLYSKRITTSKQ